MPLRLVIAATILLAATPVAAQSRKDADPFAVAVLDDKALGTVAGREDMRGVAIADQQASVSRNSVGDNVRTGDAKISDNAFQNMSGLTILNVNTGNNVAMNSAMNVTIAVQPAR